MGITSLTMPEAALIALSGLVIVFIILAVLALAVKLISKVIVATDRKTAPVAAAPAAAAVAGIPTAAPAVQHYAGEVALIGVDEKTAACIMAIVSDETGIPLSELVFKKIKAL